MIHPTDRGALGATVRVRAGVVPRLWPGGQNAAPNGRPVTRDVAAEGQNAPPSVTAAANVAKME